MKNVSIIINIVLALAIGVLYYLYFSNKPGNEPQKGESKGIEGDLKIAFINSDTVLKYFDYFKISRDKLEAKGRKMDNDLKNRANGLQREITNYQNTVSNLTIGQAKAIEEDLTKKQQNLRLYQESLGQELAMEESKLNRELYEKVTSYLKDYSAKNGIYAVFKFDPSSDLLFGGEALDITREVIEGLNTTFQQGATQASDSTKTK